MSKDDTIGRIVELTLEGKLTWTQDEGWACSTVYESAYKFNNDSEFTEIVLDISLLGKTLFIDGHKYATNEKEKYALYRLLKSIEEARRKERDAIDHEIETRILGCLTVNENLVQSKN